MTATWTLLKSTSAPCSTPPTTTTRLLTGLIGLPQLDFPRFTQLRFHFVRDVLRNPYSGRQVWSLTGCSVPLYYGDLTTTDYQQFSHTPTLRFAAALCSCCCSGLNVNAKCVSPPACYCPTEPSTLFCALVEARKWQ